MNIGLFLILEFGSIAVTLSIKCVSAMNAAIKMFEEGYFIDREKMLELNKNQTYISNDKSKALKIIKGLSLFIPGVNIIVEGLSSINTKKELYEEARKNNVLVKVPEKDSNLCKTFSKKRKMIYIAEFANRKDGEEIIGVSGKSTLVVNDPDLGTLKYDKLLPLDYDLNDVKELNNVTGYTYRVGTIDGENVAVIAIPNAGKNLKRVKFPNESYFDAHKYEEMDLDEAKSKTFTVYPYTYEDRFKDDLEAVVEEIKQSRIASNSYVENELTEEINSYDETNTHEQEGPVLRRVKTNK